MIPSLYIHIPFCRRKCLYCDFYSAIYDSSTASAYIDALTRQIDGLDGPFATVYIGGGTPSALDKGMLARLVKGIGRFLPGVSEFTMEANPESLDEEKIKLLLDAGVNRLSVGLQSFDEGKLKKLGRIHDARRAADAVSAAAKKGFKNISIDLIFGVWGERPDIWKRDLEEALKLPVTHISCYSLTYEKDTPLFQAVKNGSVKPLEDEAAAAMYEAAIELLSLRGFKQYEVSNFARGGFECRHNLAYWENNPYVGLGASAASYIEGVRSKFVSDVKGYIRRFKEARSLVESSEKLKPIKRAKETAAIKIRTKEGIDFEWFKGKTGYDFCGLERKALPKLIEDGLIKYKKDGDSPVGIVLKRKGFLFCDTVSSALL